MINDFCNPPLSFCLILVETMKFLRRKCNPSTIVCLILLVNNYQERGRVEEGGAQNLGERWITQLGAADSATVTAVNRSDRWAPPGTADCEEGPESVASADPRIRDR